METPNMVVFVVKRYAVREAKKWRYAVRNAKIERYAVRKGEGGCHPHICFHFCSICEYMCVSVILIFLFLFILFYDFDFVCLYGRYERLIILLCLQIISFILMLNACFNIRIICISNLNCHFIMMFYFVLLKAIWN